MRPPLLIVSTVPHCRDCDAVLISDKDQSEATCAMCRFRKQREARSA